MSPSAGRRLRDIYRLTDFETASRRHLPRAVYEYVRNGAGEEHSLRRNRAVFQRLLWKPYRLRDVSRIDPSVVLFGERYAQPFGLAPTGGAAVVRYDADRIAAEAARRHGLFYVLSANALTPLEDIIRINPRAWFAAYLPDDHAVIDGMIDRVAAAGYTVLMVTIDVPVAARRIPETRAGYTMPIRPQIRSIRGALARPGWSIGTIARTLLHERNPRIANILPRGGPGLFSRDIGAVGGSAGFTWDHVRRIRDRWPGKLVLKGIMRAEDAAMAAAIGVDGIGVSDHGARLLDSMVSPLEVLGEIRRAAGDTTLLVDSGFRSGSDVLKGMALGADAVMLGRPFLQACAIAGGRGIAHAANILGAEVARDLAMLGVTSFADLGSDVLHEPMRTGPGEAP